MYKTEKYFCLPVKLRERISMINIVKNQYYKRKIIKRKIQKKNMVWIATGRKDRKCAQTPN